MNTESPTVDFTYDQWIAFHWSLLPRTEDEMGSTNVAPHRVMQLERDAARSELKATALQLQQAAVALQQLGAQMQHMRLFIAATVHAAGGTLTIPHSSLDALRAEPHTMHERVDDEAKVTIVEVKKQETQPIEEPAPTPQADGEPARSLIEVVSR